jgi:hypothetical protein
MLWPQSRYGRSENDGSLFSLPEIENRSLGSDTGVHLINESRHSVAGKRKKKTGNCRASTLSPGRDIRRPLYVLSMRQSSNKEVRATSVKQSRIQDASHHTTKNASKIHDRT